MARRARDNPQYSPHFFDKMSYAAVPRKCPEPSWEIPVTISENWRRISLCQLIRMVEERMLFRRADVNDADTEILIEASQRAAARVHPTRREIVCCAELPILCSLARISGPAACRHFHHFWGASHKARLTSSPQTFRIVRRMSRLKPFITFNLLQYTTTTTQSSKSIFALDLRH